MPPSDRSYHHGDLPEVLMQTALQEIERVGVQNLSLRALARAAGVSATAPYRHFPSKRCLLAALATRGFRQLGQVMQTELKKEMQLVAPAQSTDPGERRGQVERQLLAMGLAYLAFAEAYPTTYQLMFGSVLDDFSDYEMLQRASVESYLPLQSVLEQVLALGGGRGLSLSELGGVVWSSVHGLADLLHNTRLSSPEAQAAAAQNSPAQAAMLAVRRDPARAVRAICVPLLDP